MSEIVNELTLEPSPIEGERRSQGAPSGSQPDGAEPADPRVQRFISELHSRALLRLGRTEEALAALERAASLGESGESGWNGRLGVTRMSHLRRLHRADDLFVQMDRSLSHAKLGSEIAQSEVGEIYDTILELAKEGLDSRRLRDLVEKYPVADCPQYPRERTLALLSLVLSEDERVVVHARAARALGVVDAELALIETSALVRLGRFEEAHATESIARGLDPHAFDERVESPLLKRKPK